MHIMHVHAHAHAHTHTHTHAQATSLVDLMCTLLFRAAARPLQGFFIPTLRRNHCLMTVFGTLTITFFLLAGGQWSENTEKAAGYFGFVCGCSAIYTAVAEIWEETLGLNMPGLAPVRYI